MGEPVQDHLPTRQSLLNRLRDWQDQESWAVFFEIYWRLIYGFAVKSGLSDAEAQDVVQETVVSVAKRMKDFKYDPAVGSFKSWLLLITRRRIADFHRSRMRQPQPGGGGSGARRERGGGADGGSGRHRSRRAVGSGMAALTCSPPRSSGSGGRWTRGNSRSLIVTCSRNGPRKR
jgi:hypothetical protein